MLTETLAALLLAIFVTLFLLRLRAYRLREKIGLCGPKVNLLLSNALLFLDPSVKWEINQKPLFDKLKKAYGNVYGLFIGPQLNVVVTDLDMAKEILIKKFAYFTDRSHIAILDKKPMKDCLFNLQKDEWKEVRRTVVQAFSNRYMKQMADATVPKIRHFVENLKIYETQSSEFDIYAEFQILTVNVIAQCAFALDLDSKSEQNEHFIKNCRNLFDGYDFNECWLIKLSLLFPELNLLLKPFVQFTQFSRAEQALVKDLQLLVEEKRRTNSTESSIDILQLLMQNGCPVANGEHLKKSSKAPTNLSDDAIIANALVFLLAGYETSSTAMAFAAWLLAKHERAQQRLYKEIVEKFLDTDNPYEAIQDMPYLNAIFQETLRLYPPLVLLVVRTCIRECIIKNVRFVPGVQVLFPSYSIQRDDEVWDQANSFLPERFLDNKQKQQQHPMSWLPFGAGPRNCIGKRFAEMQFKLTMAQLVGTYQLQLSQGSQDPIETKSNGATIKPSRGVVMKIISRL